MRTDLSQYAILLDYGNDRTIMNMDQIMEMIELYEYGLEYGNDRTIMNMDQIMEMIEL